MRKGRPKDLEREKAATVLMEAAFNPDEEVCHKYSISRRTLQRYQRELETDRLLAGAVARKKAAFDRVWAEEMPTALLTALDAMRSIMRALREDPVYRSNPLALSTVTETFRVLAEVELTMRALEIRLGRNL